MKRIWIVLGVLAAAGAGLAWWASRTGGREGQGLLPLGPTRMDFPPVVRGEAGELVQHHDFRFRNDLGHPVRVASATASCPCTTATTSSDEVPAGGELVVHTITTLEHAASRHATVWVRFADGEGVQMHVSAALLRPVILNTSPPNPRPAEGADEAEFILVWTDRDADGSPGTPTIAADRGTIEAEFGPWTQRALDVGVFGPDGPAPGARSLGSIVRLRKQGDRWPVIVTFAVPEADPLPIQLRDLLPGE